MGLLRTYAWGEIKQQPWRTLSVVVTIALGVALALGVHLINHSALNAFSQASNTAQGAPDWTLRSRSDAPLPFNAWTRLQQQPDITLMAPEVEGVVRLRVSNNPEVTVPLTLIGMDTLAQAGFNPAQLPQSAATTDRLAFFAPDSIYLNADALALWSTPPKAIDVFVDGKWVSLAIRGRVAHTGSVAGVMDVAAAQALLGLGDDLHRIQIRVSGDVAGLTASALATRWQLSEQWVLQAPSQSANQLARMTQAYRVNLTVLALVALFTGTFLVFAALSLSVTKRLSQFALLGILGLTRPERLRVVLSEAAILGLLGSALGVVLAAALARVLS